MRRRTAGLLVVCGLAEVVAGIGAAEASELGQPRSVSWAQDAQWYETYINTPDGTILHADVLRPKGLPDGVKTPVILSVGPYFNHSGGSGIFGAIDGAPFAPSFPSEPSNRFADLLEGGQLMARGYTFVMVDLRGFGGSTGCLDYLGPGEQADVSNAVQWAANQSWSTGSVGMYGKSYDGATGIMGVAAQPAGLRAVVSQEPFYDGYRWLYQNGVRYANSLIEGFFYGQDAATPGIPGSDSKRYIEQSLYELTHPGCLIGNAWAQGRDTNHGSAYWKARDFTRAVNQSSVPLFLTQGFIENNTLPDGLVETLTDRVGPTHAWLGMWNHVRGNDIDEDSGRLAMGRTGWFDEVMRFYDQHLKGTAPAVLDPSIVIEDNTGAWHSADRWPTATRVVSAPAPLGRYTDLGTAVGSLGTQIGTVDPLALVDVNAGLWTASEPLSAALRIAGAPSVTLTTSSDRDGANLVVDLYDVDASGTALRITRAATLLPAGTATTTFGLSPTDWLLQPGHLLAVRIVNANSEMYIHKPSGARVQVEAGSLDIPIDDAPVSVTAGDRSVFLDKYLSGAGIYPLKQGQAFAGARFPLW